MACCTTRGCTVVTGAAGGGGGPGAVSVTYDCNCGSTCGQISGASNMPPTSSAWPVTPAHVLQRRDDTGAVEKVACSNIIFSSQKCGDTPPLASGGGVSLTASTQVDTALEKKFRLVRPRERRPSFPVSGRAKWSR